MDISLKNKLLHDVFFKHTRIKNFLLFVLFSLKANVVLRTDYHTAFKSAVAVARFSDGKGRQELIWTGPATSTVAVRHTEQALCEVIQSAARKLFIVSFIAYKADGIIATLTDALLRNVRIDFLLEPSKEHGGAVDIDSVAILREKLPTANFYTWAAKQNIGAASVHAKCAVADESMALITSANLTGKAMECNMELGVLIRDGALPRQLSNHLYGLISEKVIAKMKEVQANVPDIIDLADK